MIDPENVPDVSDNELLARFIVYSDHFKDGSVTSKAFIAYKYTDLSVTRYREASPEEIWQAALNVATQRSRPLYGIADIQAGSCRELKLTVSADPITEADGIAANPNHALIAGFPPAKQDQMSFAQELAAKANQQGGFKPAPQ